jgi:hypothetical protein
MFTFDGHSNLVDGKRHHVVDIILVNLPLIGILAIDSLDGQSILKWAIFKKKILKFHF